MPIELRLENARHISQYMASVAGNDDFNREFAEEFFQDAAATLTRFRVDSLADGHSDANLRDEVKERRYIAMDPETSPPIMVEMGKAVDGGHRLRAARARGDMYILGYDVHAMDEFPKPHTGPLNAKQDLPTVGQSNALSERKILAEQAQLYLDSLKIRVPRPE